MIDIAKIARLACVQLSDQEKNEFSQDLAKILKAFEKLSEVDTLNTQAMVTPTEMKQVWREDRAINWSNAKQGIEAAPELSGNLFKVPPVV